MPNFSIPLSGLTAESTALSTIANNLANQNTTGFKSKVVLFSDLHSSSTQLAQQQNNIAGADLSRVLSDLLNAQTSREATLETIGRTQQNNLFDYLK